jgi:hypothetical protein
VVDPAVLSERFSDPDLPLESYLDEVLVDCPRCDGCARIVPVDGAPWPARGDWRRDRRLTCINCALVRSWPGPDGVRTARLGTVHSVTTRLPTWCKRAGNREELLRALATAGSQAG